MPRAGPVTPWGQSWSARSIHPRRSRLRQSRLDQVQAALGQVQDDGWPHVHIAAVAGAAAVASAAAASASAATARSAYNL